MGGMGWSVVEGIDAPVTVAEVVRRLGGDPAELFELPAEEAFDADACEALVCLAPHGSAVALFEPGSPQAVRPEVLRRLSAGARVHATCWHVNGGERLLYAAYGKLVTGIQPYWPKERWGELPDTLDEDLRALGGFAVEDPDLRPRPEDHAGAIALAAIERRTGVRATADWLAGPHTAVRIARPVPDDPQPRTTFARVDPDLDAWLRLAPEETRRAAVRLALRRVVERFDLTGDPVVALLIGAVEAGEAVPGRPGRGAGHPVLPAPPGGGPPAPSPAGPAARPP